MRNDSTAYSNYYSCLFLAAAAFNFVIALSFFFISDLAIELLDINGVDNPVFTRLFAWLVLIFGFFYFWSSRNLDKAPIVIGPAAVGKFGIFLLAVTEFKQGNADVSIIHLASVDLIFGVFFIHFLFSRENR